MEFIRLSGTLIAKLRQYRKHRMHGHLAYKKSHLSMRKNQELKLLASQSLRTQNQRHRNQAFQTPSNIKTVLIQANCIFSFSAQVLMLHDFLTPPPTDVLGHFKKPRPGCEQFHSRRRWFIDDLSDSIALDLLRREKNFQAVQSLGLLI